jgi:hypothetical protein
MSIFKQIGQSVYGRDFYAGLRAEKTTFSIKYYLKLGLLLSILPALGWSVFVLPDIRAMLEPENVSAIVSNYPAELELKIKDGQFSTNVVEPYSIPVPAGFTESEDSTSESKVKNLVVIDTSIESISPSILKDNSAAFFITKNSIIGPKDGGLQVISMSEYERFTYTLNQAGINTIAQKVAPILSKLLYIAPLFIYIGLFLGFVFLLISILIVSLIVWWILVIKKNSAGYKHAFRVTTHAFTLGLIIDMVYMLFITDEPFSWFLLALLAIIVVLINVKKAEVAVTPVPPVAPAINQ